MHKTAAVVARVQRMRFRQHGRRDIHPGHGGEMRGQRDGQPSCSAAEIERVVARRAQAETVQVGHGVRDLGSPGGEELLDIPAAAAPGGIHTDRPQRICLAQPGPVAVKPGEALAGAHPRSLCTSLGGKLHSRLLESRRKGGASVPQSERVPVTGWRWPGLAGAVIAGLLLGMLALGPGLGRGFLLSYDMVAVPRQPFTAAMFGLTRNPPRAVPSDAVAAAVARALPADVVQKLLLLSIFVLACSGMAALLAGEHWLARMAGAVFYAWNPFVAERLIIGQWALLLGYGALPWVLRAVAMPAGPRWRWAGRLMLALLPAAVGGVSAMCLSALVVLPAAACATGRTARQRVLSAGTALLILAVLSLPWLIPALAWTVHTSSAGVAALAARADTPFGALGSLLMLGGVWNAQAVPAGYGSPLSVLWMGLALGGLGGDPAVAPGGSGGP